MIDAKSVMTLCHTSTPYINKNAYGSTTGDKDIRNGDILAKQDICNLQLLILTDYIYKKIFENIMAKLQNRSNIYNPGLTIFIL